MGRPPRPLVWLLALAALVAGGIVVFPGLRALFSDHPSAPSPVLRLESLRPAPEFRLRRFDGAPLALSDLKGEVVVINFWASWCTPCKREMPNLERVWREFKNRGVIVLGIDVQDDMEDAAAFITSLGITYPNVFDPAQDRLFAYQVTGIPTTIFIDRDQRIRERFAGGYLGESGLKELRRQIQALLDSNP